MVWARRMVAILVAALLLAAAIAPAGAEHADERLQSVESFAFAIGNKTLKGDLAERYAGYDLVIFDGQEARPRQIKALQEQGMLVLGYLSVGTIEEYRPWYKRLKRYRLEAWKDWEDEYFAQVSKRGFRKQISERIAPQLLAKGFDGLFLDNVDMIENHKREAAGMRKLVKQLGALTHGDGELLLAQNGFEILDRFIPYLDGWNREDVTGSYDFDRDRYKENSARQILRTSGELREVAEAGLLVLTTDYTKRADSPVAGRAVANSCEAGALPYVSDINLRRVPEDPHRCP